MGPPSQPAKQELLGGFHSQVTLVSHVPKSPRHVQQKVLLARQHLDARKQKRARAPSSSLHCNSFAKKECHESCTKPGVAEDPQEKADDGVKLNHSLKKKSKKGKTQTQFIEIFAKLEMNKTLYSCSYTTGEVSFGINHFNFHFLSRSLKKTSFKKN
jgi:hypothetical protein